MTVTTELAEKLKLIKTDVMGRVRVPAWKREEILDEFDRSAMSGQAFAEYVGVKYPTFAGWVQKRRLEQSNGKDEKVQECGAAKADKADDRATIELFEVQMGPAGAERAEKTGPGLRIETPCGHRLWVCESASLKLAVELMRALRR